MKNKSDTRRALLETGVMLFGEKGYHGTGINEVVKSLGVPKGSFYNYFKSKEHFACEIVAYYAGRLDILWDGLMANGPEEDPLVMLRGCFEQLIALQEGQTVSTGCLIGNLAGELSESSEQCRMALNKAKTHRCQRFAVQLARAQEMGVARQDIPPDALAGFCWDVWEGGLLRMKVENTTKSLHRSMTMLFDIFLRG